MVGIPLVPPLARSRAVASPDLAEEPGLRGLPVPHDRLGGDVQDIRRFFDGEATEEPQLDDLAHTRVEYRQRAKCITESGHVALFRLRQLSDVIDTQANCIADPFMRV